MLEIAQRLGFAATSDELAQFSCCVKDWPAFPDASDALRRLQAKYHLVILSNIDDELFEFSRQKLDIEFYRILTAQQIGSYKPSLRNFEYALQHLDLSKQQILHVAQSLFHDIKPANEIGLATVWINRRKGLKGFGATPPAQAKPDMEVGSLRELAELIGL